MPNDYIVRFLQMQVILKVYDERKAQDVMGIMTLTQAEGSELILTELTIL
jgi:glutaredoxin-related protein